jgi:tetratricopeptide (TPR) repeat protein
LEEGSTFLRANQPAEALKVLDAAMARLPQDSRSRMPGEEVRWQLKRGIARLRLGMLNEADQDLRAAAGGKDARGWVLARIRIELGKVADLRGDRAKAQTEYRTAAALATAVGDDEAATEANRLLGRAYKQ